MVKTKQDANLATVHFDRLQPKLHDYYLFETMIETKYPNQTNEIFAFRNSAKDCIVQQHQFVTIGNIKIGNIEREKKSKNCKDSTIELKPKERIPFSRISKRLEQPQFASVLQIISIQPFRDADKKHKTYFFIKIGKFKTVGHHRSL